MKRSKRSNIIATTRLLPHFSQDNLNVMQLCIFNQVGCSCESQYICEALHSLHNIMSVESSAIIRNKAIEIADSQSMAQSPIQQQTKNSSTNPNGSNDNHITVYKYIEQQYNDRLSKLPSDIIDYLGSFLTKKESIEFGYLNSQLFIETQKYSYLLQRLNVPKVYIGGFSVARLMDSRRSLFHDYFTKDLCVASYGRGVIEYTPKLSFLDNVFRRVNTIECANFKSLSLIPCHILFDIDHNYFRPNCEQRYEMAKVSIHGRVSVRHDDENKVPETVNTFCEKFNKYKNSVKNGNDNNNNTTNNIKIGNNKYKVRCIKQLVLNFCPYRSNKTKGVTNKLLFTLGSICKSIEIENGYVMIETMQQLKNVFHKNLKTFCLFGKSSIAFKDGIKIDSNITTNGDDDNANIGNLEILGCDLSNFDFFNCFDQFNMKRLIKRYVLEWSPRAVSRNNNIFNVFNKILFQDYDKHPKLEKITIKFRDDTKLSNFAKLLVCLNQHYNKLFKHSKDHLKHFKLIELEFDGIGRGFENLQTHTPPQGNTGDSNDDNELIFNFASNEEYPRNEKVIEIENVEQGIKSFGIIFKNTFKWLQKMRRDVFNLYMRRGNESNKPLDEETTVDLVPGCKIVFLV